MDVSIIIPIFNEADSVRPLHDRLTRVLPQLPSATEIVYVDDGSNDGSAQRLDEIAAADRRVTVVHFRRNYGQTAAMQAGLEQARGRVLVTLDGDLQNDPDDIPAMLEAIDQGADLVHGWRKDRHDTWLTRKLPSLIANRLISRVTGLPIHDLGCTLKAIRSEVADELDLYGEMHRFIPVLAHARGARCQEMVVTHHARQYGTSKYGLSRTTRVVLDLITVKFLIDYMDRPMKLLGRLALAALGISGLSGLGVVAMKLAGGIDMTGNPLLLLTVFMGIVSLQFMGLGLLGEMNTRLYYQRSNRRPFAIRSVTQSAALPATVHRAA
ncbi:Undecaprenyl-phosphate 4-deoxy-4-formamido-L-arabinose transferase [Rosistilla carotiformis]|uniref:Undecaprenyl-phosphate 4-deoxy-4-formamido-L-arabinose transferase n=1 Tax=Rosistilla carotiformis TaxID=2528017 RepID=A0A518JSG7_9BACT|nr:glycosyltransferase family 2 protein [Rosistilla carotiformis]QDV68493.1 Undecaprenyl-phosphate 4-deoxy-4-formamido-L-arabinose transferase [Rosistilla carotiformis]